ncbi:DMT family transporter [Gallaecimonas mangrovi]|uniref:DMT family transporter n=1 Tax=Gallaecimonas mangrovi TaxID=2291597 RepID=UPI000E209BDB|nr:DMT family transporter [Gallaecimonas mangrovi]
MGVFAIIAILAGAMLPLQAVFNARLGNALGSPIWAASVSAMVSAVLLFVVGVAITGTLPCRTQLHVLPPWAWIGGLCGVITLAGVTACAPRLGAGTMVALVVAGQVIFALLLDRFGLFGLTPHPLSLQRIVAAVLLLAGMVLIQ